MSGPNAPSVSPQVSVVVPTRNRPEDAAACVGLILACSGSFELVVIDQSEDSATKDSLSPYATDARLRYVRSATRGVSAARNAGVALTLGPIVAFTDDDCRVPGDWVERLQTIFATDSSVAIVCGRVTTPAGSEALGFAARFEPQRRFYQGVFPPPGGDWGLSANMIVRRDVFASIGIFDEQLGAGAALRSGAETDLLVRALSAGLTVVNASEVVVLHLGVRPYGPAERALRRGYMFGTGAMFCKHIRLGGPGRWLYLRWLAHLLKWNARSLVTLTRPIGLGFTAAFLRGAFVSLSYSIDRESALYRKRPASGASRHPRDRNAEPASNREVG